tara:strand:- start:350 stop:1093 length:744 start_codon:yes stop_codon:yes gene_type:complete
MDRHFCEITPTPEQIQLLSKQQNVHHLHALRTADFLAKQPYIDQWILDWFKCNDIQIQNIPLCVSETLHINKRLKKIYKRKLGKAISNNNTLWVKSHYIVDFNDFNPWNYVLFEHIGEELFHFLWNKRIISIEDGIFMVPMQHLHIWKLFVSKHGPTDTIELAIRQEWFEGVKHCIDEGAWLEDKDVVQYCVRKADIFRYITQVPTLATKKAYQEFIFQKQLGRIENIPLVEEWFYCNGFKEVVSKY